jgi:hypothetical protein
MSGFGVPEFWVPEQLDEFEPPDPVGCGILLVPEEDVIYRPADENDLERIRTEP